MLDTSVASVNSALQRARATLEARRSQFALDRPLDPADVKTRDLLRRYVGAWEGGDAQALTALLREDAILSMPPLPTWYQGRGTVVGFLEGIFAKMGPFRGRDLAICGGAGVAVYLRAPDGRFRPRAVHALTVDASGALARIDAFMDPRTFGPFALPAEL